jgi:hypothetical protein
MVNNATFNNISVISWRSVLLVEETKVPGENHWHFTSHWETLSHNVGSSTPRHERGSTLVHRRLCRVKNMLAMYLKYHKAGLTPTTSVTSTAISSVKMAIGHKSLTNLRSEMIFLQGKPVFYIFLPSTPPYWQIILRFCW